MEEIQIFSKLLCKKYYIHHVLSPSHLIEEIQIKVWTFCTDDTTASLQESRNSMQFGIFCVNFRVLHFVCHQKSSSGISFFVPYQPSRHRKNLDQPIGSMSYLNQEKTLLRGRQQKAFMHFFVSFNDSNWVSSDFNAILIMSVWRLTHTLFQEINSFETTYLTHFIPSLMSFTSYY